MLFAPRASRPIDGVSLRVARRYLRSNAETAAVAPLNGWDRELLPTGKFQPELMILLALPRGAHETNENNGLGKGLGENHPIGMQEISETPPKPSCSPAFQRPDLLVNTADLPATALDVRGLLA